MDTLKSPFIFYGCDFCLYKTKLPSVMENHMKKHWKPEKISLFNCGTSELEPYQCNECDFETDLKSILFSQHVRRGCYMEHLPEKELEYTLDSYICKTCPFETSSLLVFGRHLCKEVKPREIEEKPVKCYEAIKPMWWYECNQCEYKTHKKSHIQRHQKRHPLPGWFNCSHCCKKFTQEDHLQVHLELHKNFKCDQCPYTSTSRYNFLKHKKRRHSKPEKWFKCDHCVYETQSEYNFIRHGKRHSSVTRVETKCSKPESIRWLKCDQCGSKTQIMYRVQRDGKKQQPDNFECQHCCKKFTRKYVLKARLLVQVDLKSDECYKCDQCPFETKYKCNLSRHLATVHCEEENIEWFKCEQCSYQCKIKKYLEKHVLMSHTHVEAITKYKCGNCSYETKYRERIKTHIARIHEYKTTEKRFGCPHCTFSTTHKKGLISHMRSVHVTLNNTGNSKSEQ